MELDASVCYRALRARDARFDGRFFTAVRTTGIYCRPVCPAPCPRLENCTFLPCAAAAQEAQGQADEQGEEISGAQAPLREGTGFDNRITR